MATTVKLASARGVAAAVVDRDRSRTPHLQGRSL